MQWVTSHSFIWLIRVGHCVGAQLVEVTLFVSLFDGFSSPVTEFFFCDSDGTCLLDSQGHFRTVPWDLMQLTSDLEGLISHLNTAVLSTLVAISLGGGRSTYWRMMTVQLEVLWTWRWSGGDKAMCDASYMSVTGLLCDSKEIARFHNISKIRMRGGGLFFCLRVISARLEECGIQPNIFGDGKWKMTLFFSKWKTISFLNHYLVRK